MSAIIEFWKSAKGALSPGLRKSKDRLDREENRRSEADARKLVAQKSTLRLSTGKSVEASRRPGNDESSTQRYPSNKRFTSPSKSSTWASPTSDWQKPGSTSRRSLDRGSSHRVDTKREHDSVTGENFIELSDFTVQGTAGEGSFGTVFKATWKDNGTVVALKALKPKEDFLAIIPENELRSVYKNIYDAFKREIKFLEQAGKHPNIVSLHGKSRDYKMCALALECCDLFQLVRAARKTLPLSVAHGVAVGMLAGVSHLHEIGIIHQDIKSSNILLDGEGNAKLCDFGLAIANKGEVKVDREIITLWYRAPELLMGCATYDRRVDDWAVGCILLEMLVGGVAFPGDPAQACTCDSHRHLNFNRDQLGRIFKVIGTPAIDPRSMACQAHFAKWPSFAPCLSQLIAEACRDRVSAPRQRNGPASMYPPDKASLDDWTMAISELLRIDPRSRISCAEALGFPLFRSASPPPPGRPGNPVHPAPLRLASDCSVDSGSSTWSGSPSPSPSTRAIRRPGSKRRSVEEGRPILNADQLLRHLAGGLEERLPSAGGVRSSRLPSIGPTNDSRGGRDHTGARPSRAEHA